MSVVPGVGAAHATAVLHGRSTPGDYATGWPPPALGPD
nr:MAG TPA: hypothetical protein [Caudoviricetes sp.]